MKDKRLLERIKAGDEAVFTELFEVHHAAVFNLCFRMLGDLQETEDITQEVFFKAFLKLKKFRGESEFSTWLYRIAVNLCLNHQRRKRYKKILSLDFLIEKGNQQAGGQGKGPLEELTRKEEKLLIKKSIDSLTKNQRIAVILNHYEGLPYREISEVMGLSVSSVRSLIYRAKQRLSSSLKNT
jgi:RNA polymerase sigma-70 factor (ECF subfamily)